MMQFIAAVPLWDLWPQLLLYFGVIYQAKQKLKCPNFGNLTGSTAGNAPQNSRTLGHISHS